MGYFQSNKTNLKSILKPCIGLLIIFLLASCAAPATALTPTNTAIPIEPSPTPIPPLVLGNFSARLEGMGTNGTMACFDYAGPASDLKNIKLTANLSQGSKVLEKSITVQVIEGKNCFEVVDAKYVSVNPKDGTLVIPEEPVKLEITATAKDGRQLTNSKQALDLGKYIQFPFLAWVFPTEKLACKSEYSLIKTNMADNHKAWDFVPKPDTTYPTLLSFPWLSPFDGKVIYVVLNGQGNNNIVVYSPSTGYLTFMKHGGDTGFIEGKPVRLDKLVGAEFKAGEKISTMGFTEPSHQMPHLHWSMTIKQDIIQKFLSGSKNEIDLLTNSDAGSDGPGGWVNYVKSNLFLNQNIENLVKISPSYSLNCKNLPWGLPEQPQSQLPIKIDGQADDWASYQPVLTDSAGDSELGTIMDFTELYTAKDDNYLYVMLKAGRKPAGEWSINLFLDTVDGGQCGTADKMAQVWSKYPDAVSVQTPNGCDYGDDNTRYQGLFKWVEDVLEIRIPLVSLGDYKSLNVTQTTSSVLLKDNWQGPDIMP